MLFRSHQDDCIACHMPKSAVADAQHVVYTDHSIPRRPRTPSPSALAPAGLEPFGGFTATQRDTALAYAIAAGRTGASGQARARALLEAAQKDFPNDPEILLYLAEIYRNNGLPDRAVPLYRQAMALDSTQVTGSVGMGGIFFERGEDRGAIQFWRDALSKNPGLVLVATNLAMAQWRSGDRSGAESTIRKVIAISPAFAPARDILKGVIP